MTARPALLLALAGEAWSQDLVVPFCDATWLDFVNCPRYEHGIDWEVFLSSACEKCRPDEPCDFIDQDAGLQMARYATSLENSQSFSCAAGILSAMIIITQYFLIEEPSSDLTKYLGNFASLAPFPFYTSQYSRYANMVPLSLRACNEEQQNGPSLYNRFVPRVHAEDSGLCGMVYTDNQLVRRCRAMRRNVGTAERSSRAIEDIQCPETSDLSVEADLGRKIAKYNNRANQLQCQDSRGMWNEAMSDVHKCVLITVSHWLGFRPGQLVLDWGSGCGHKLSWAKMLFDVDGMGVEIQETAVLWAQRHSAGKFCHGDGRNLSWIPEDTFDYVISYASIYHLTTPDQCSVGIQLVRKLKIGGKAFLGWNHGPVMNNWEWLKCFRDSHAIVQHTPGLGRAGVEVDFEAVEDGNLFPPDSRVMEDKKSFLYQYPAYSIFLTRRA
mmetsp:Transcript_6066/g.11077  ORF Transcript_6066/g.11077 Transcript_6066/m.11077 type:complete len:440 (-) Transcript_6066:63-1382(-)